MLTRLVIRNFKLFDEVDLELGERVVLIGPNNAGKTTALQALALWSIGVRRWIEERGSGPVPRKRPGVTINRRDLITIPVPNARLLWRDLHVRRGVREGGQNRTSNVLVEVMVEGIAEGRSWACTIEFDFANEESLYCRPKRLPEGGLMEVPEVAAGVRVAFLPAMSGLSPTETRLERGAIDVRLGEGRTAEVLRNLCYLVREGEEGETRWGAILSRMHSLFGVEIEPPEYLPARGEIVMAYRDRAGIRLDISACGRGQQQTLLLLAHMTANPGAVLLLDEPDAHLEILRQRQIYQILSETASATGSQIIAASHSEVILNEAADRDVVIAFVGRPHRIDDRGSQVTKALKEIGFEHYYQAEETGWVLYLEGATDLAVLRALARKLDHAAADALDRPFAHYVGNQPVSAQDHFHGLREAKRDLCGVALYDRLDRAPVEEPYLRQSMWRRREIESYLCQRETLLAYAESKGREQVLGELGAARWQAAMERAVGEIEGALGALGKPSPWGPDLKVTDDFLDPLFRNFFEELGLPNLMRKTDYHALALFVPAESVDPEVREKLDLILEVAGAAAPRRG